jgi:hypothetical protein
MGEHLTFRVAAQFGSVELLFSRLASLSRNAITLTKEINMSDSHNAQQAAEVAMGAVTELARQGGQKMSSHNTYGAEKAGELLVRGAAVVAPGAVAVASAGTAAVMSTASAAMIAAAPVLAPALVVGAVGYGVYKVVEWLKE